MFCFRFSPHSLTPYPGYPAFALVFHSTKPGPGVWQVHCGGRLLSLSPGDDGASSGLTFRLGPDGLCGDQAWASHLILGTA